MNKIRKHDSTASPSPASATYGPATAGIQYDLKTNGGLQIIKDSTAGWDMFDLGKITAKSSDHLKLNSSGAGKSVRINVRTISTDEDESFIGFVSKPGIGITHANSKELKGGEISPRLSDGVAWPGSVIGLHTDVYLKGTSAGAVGGDVRALQLELVTDTGGTRAITGYVAGIRLRTAWSSGAPSGGIHAIRIEKPEAQSNSKTFTSVLQLTSSVAGVWDINDTTFGDGSHVGFFKVELGGTVGYVRVHAV